MCENIASGSHFVLVESAMLPIVIWSHQASHGRSLCHVHYLVGGVFSLEWLQGLSHPTRRGLQPGLFCALREYKGILGWKASGIVLEGSHLLGAVPQVSCHPHVAELCHRKS